MAVSAIGVANDTNFALYFKDNRDTFLYREAFPDELINNIPDGEVNISGVITLKLAAPRYLTLLPPKLDGDTLRYEVYMKDKNGVESNKITTSDIYILP